MTNALVETATATKQMAVIYLRVSTKDQAERGGQAEGFSIPAQRGACIRKAESLGADVVEEFVDAGESARSANRPELQKMLAFIKENSVNYVIVHKVDRLARNRVDDVEINVALTATGAQLVSCSENIDETPSGMLLHGIMSSIAEFYSRNLATEVSKGMLQKVIQGGTVSKAPIGYQHSRVLVDGREVSTIEVDPERAPLVSWAFDAYASGDWSTRSLLEEITARGLTTHPGPRTPPKELSLSQVHRMLRNPYYTGKVTYRGTIYDGSHKPLISQSVFDCVQRLLDSNYQAGEKRRIHHHYLKGSVWCKTCGYRLIITMSKNRHGTVYPYFICLGRHQKYTDCTQMALRVELVEYLVAEHYRQVELSPELRHDVETTLRSELKQVTDDAASRAAGLEQARARLLKERARLLRAHYADAVPLDLLKTEQARIARQLTSIDASLEVITTGSDLIQANLGRTLDFVQNAHAAYITAENDLRREYNQFFFEKIFVGDDEAVASDLAPTLEIVLGSSSPVRVAPAATTLGHQSRRPSKETATNPTNRDSSVVGLKLDTLVGLNAFG